MGISGFKGLSLGFKVVVSFGFRVGLGFRTSGVGFGVQDLGLSVWDVGFRIWGLGFGT